jgi:hypothetical protein
MKRLFLLGKCYNFKERAVTKKKEIKRISYSNAKFFLRKRALFHGTPNGSVVSCFLLWPDYMEHLWIRLWQTRIYLQKLFF